MHSKMKTVAYGVKKTRICFMRRKYITNVFLFCTDCATDIAWPISFEDAAGNVQPVNGEWYQSMISLSFMRRIDNTHLDVYVDKLSTTQLSKQSRATYQTCFSMYDSHTHKTSFFKQKPMLFPVEIFNFCLDTLWTHVTCCRVTCVKFRVCKKGLRSSRQFCFSALRLRRYYSTNPLWR